MGIYIKGMEMPKDCGECFACKAELSQEKKVIYVCCFTRCVEADCPLVPVPPHGDLVDRAEMREIAISLLDKAVTDQEANAIREMWSHLGQMPAYIPASEEGET